MGPAGGWGGWRRAPCPARHPALLSMRVHARAMIRHSLPTCTRIQSITHGDTCLFYALYVSSVCLIYALCMSYKHLIYVVCGTQGAFLLCSLGAGRVPVTHSRLLPFYPDDALSGQTGPPHICIFPFSPPRPAPFRVPGTSLLCIPLLYALRHGHPRVTSRPVSLTSRLASFDAGRREARPQPRGSLPPVPVGTPPEGAVILVGVGRAVEDWGREPR